MVCSPSHILGKIKAHISIPRIYHNCRLSGSARTNLVCLSFTFTILSILINCSVSNCFSSSDLDANHATNNGQWYFIFFLFHIMLYWFNHSSLVHCQVSESLLSPFSSFRAILWTSRIPLLKVQATTALLYHVSMYPYLRVLIIWSYTVAQKTVPMFGCFAKIMQHKSKKLHNNLKIIYVIL